MMTQKKWETESESRRFNFQGVRIPLEIVVSCNAKIKQHHREIEILESERKMFLPYLAGLPFVCFKYGSKIHVLDSCSNGEIKLNSYDFLDLDKDDHE